MSTAPLEDRGWVSNLDVIVAGLAGSAVKRGGNVKQGMWVVYLLDFMGQQLIGNIEMTAKQCIAELYLS